MSKNADKTFSTITLATFCTISVASIWCAPSHSQNLVEKRLVDDGFDLVGRYQYQKAVAAMTEAINKYSLPCNSDFNSAAQYLSRLSSDKKCDALINNANYKAESYNIRAIAYASLKKPDAAFKDFNSAISIFPESTTFICNRGRLFLNQGNFAKAEEDARRAISIDSKMTQAHQLLGAVYEKQKHFKKANTIYNTSRALESKRREDNVYLYTVAITTAAIALNPNNPQLYRARAYVSWDEHKRRAESDYRKALALDRKCAAAYAGLAGIFVDSRNFKQAESLLEKAVQLEPITARFWYNKGVMYSLWGQNPKAFACYAKAISLEPSNPNYWRCRSNIKLKMGDTKGAMEDCLQSLKLYPRYAQGFIQKAQILEKTRKYNEAIDAAGKAIALAPRRIEAYICRSNCYKALGKAALARADMAFANTLKPKVETTHPDKREVDSVIGDLESAMAQDQKAAKNAKPDLYNDD